jgi:tRNA A-37 threonylcarbamoyl transferase component Bud32
MTTPAFFINFNLPKIETAARSCGFSGANWKQDVLADLLHDGRLSVEKGHDPRDPSKRVWYCKGRVIALACVPDVQSKDTLFCIGLVPRSQIRSSSARRTTGFDVPGPWGIHTFSRRPSPPITIEEHLLKCGDLEDVPAPIKPAPGPKHSPTLTTKSFASLLAAAHPTPPPTTAPTLRPATPATPPSGEITIPNPEARAHTSADAAGMGEPAKPPIAVPDPDVVDTIDAVVDHTPLLTTESTRLIENHGANDHPLTAPVEHEGEHAQHDEEGAEGHSSSANSAENKTHAPDTTTADVPAPTAQAGSSFSAEEWETPTWQSFRGLDTWDALAIAVIVRTKPAFDGILQAPDQLDARRQRIARLEAEIARLQKELESVPEEAALIEGDELRRRISSLGPKVSAKPPPDVSLRGPSKLEALLANLTDEAVSNLPQWAIGFDPDDDADRVRVLCDPSLQERIFAALTWVRKRFAGAPPDRLRGIAAPSGSIPIEEMLELAWQTEEELREATGMLPPNCLPLLRRLPSSSIRQVVTWLSSWLAALAPTAFDDLVSIAVNDSEQRLTLLNSDRIDELSAEDREFLKDMATFDKARRFLERLQRAPLPAPAPISRRREATGQILDFGHVLTDDRGNITAASIIVPAPDRGSSLVLLALPIRAIADTPISKDIEIIVSSPALTAVSRDAILPEDVRIQAAPSLAPTISTKFELRWRLPREESRWRLMEPGRYSREELLSFPITLGEAAKLRDRKTPRLSLSLTESNVSVTLQFENFLKEMPPLAARTGVGDASATDLVRERPLGAQVQHEKLEGVVEEGRLSFMVVAPRRFGKTTLYLHLADHARSLGHAVVHISLERDLSPDLAVQKVWEGLRHALERQFQASPVLGEKLPRTIVDETAWTAIRRFIRARTGRSLVVLIDEAQALVPRHGGQRWGNQFKNFIERFLSEPSENMAIVQLGLFGTVDLSVRIGQNCRDFLLMHGTEQYAFDERSLARFLRTVGQGAILSSKAARLELASWTSNLRTLNSVFDLVRDRVVRLQHAFIVDTDIHASIAEILSEGSHLAEDIWKYARAELSHHDEWEPVDSFPLAVAWARPELAQLPQPQRLEDCVQWLSGELAASGASGSIPAERVEGSLRDLKARGVLRDDGEFYRPLLRELLRRRPRVLREDRDSQMALLRLAVDDVEWPEQAEPRGEGGEAKVFIQARGDRTFAYRACKLDSDESRRRFARTCAAIRTLRDRRTKLPGDDHLPRVVQAGFRRDDSSEGIIVYEWIEGESFELLWPSLPAQGRAHVVRQVAMAVSALHARDVIHCDVAPRNIIINSRLEATLIDFGLARRADQGTHTRLGKDAFKAPEQCEDPPSVDKASDVYALAILLRGPNANPDFESSGLSDLVAKMSRTKVEDRPQINDVVKTLDDLVEFEPGVHQLKKKVEDVVTDAPEWLWEDLLQSAGAATLVLGGYLQWDLQRAMDVSFLLHNLFVRTVSERRGSTASKLASLVEGEELSLASARTKVRANGDSTLREWECSEVKAVGLMRIALAHPTDRKARITDATYALASREATFVVDIQRAIKKVASMLDTLAETGEGRAISRFVSFFMQDK